MFKKRPHCEYQNNHLAEVICQLRFPQILSINTNLPAEFQDHIRSEFPKFTAQNETHPPRIIGNQGNLQLDTPPATKNYCFVSLDDTWRVNLTDSFISLTCNRYTNWRTFAKMLDVPLASFIQIYKPACFERIGLRYMNFFSREKLDMQESPFSEFFAAPYIGILSNPEIPESAIVRNNFDADLALSGGCKIHIHTGPSLVTQNGVKDKEIKFVVDLDVFTSGNIPVKYSAGSLEMLHDHAFAAFSDIITDTLHNAMEPITD